MPQLQLLLLALIIPVLFAGQAAFVWTRRRQRPGETWRWLIALVLAGAWGSQVVSFFLDDAVQATVGFPWRTAAGYALPLLGLALLWSTVAYLSIPLPRQRLAFAIGLALLGGAIALDPAIWPYELSPLTMGTQTLTHFDLWGAVWGASWLLPVLTAWILTRQTYRRVPESSYRNHIDFWALSLLTFIAGGLPALIRDPGQPLWSVLAATIFFGASLAGTTTLLGQNLPDFRFTLRQLLRRGLILLLVLVLAWIGLSFLARTSTGRRLTDSDLGLAIAAALATLGFLVIQRLLSWLTRRIFLPTVSAPPPPAAPAAWRAILDRPETFAQHFVEQIQDKLQIADAWLALASTSESGAVSLTPLINRGVYDTNTATLAADSRLLAHWRQQRAPLVSYDIHHDSSLSDLSAADHDLIDSWQCDLLLPLLLGDELVGLIGLGARADDEAYTHQDLTWLANLAAQMGPLLAQTRTVAALTEETRALTESNRELQTRLRLLEEMRRLHQQCLNLVTPDLRQPIRRLDEQWQQHLNDLPFDLSQQYADLTPAIAETSRIINRLVQVILRVQQHSAFHFQEVQITDVCRQAIDNLTAMAQSRRVQINLLLNNRLPAVYGDPLRLQEGIQYLLHNAIKFNKIGGSVDIECQIQPATLCLTISDTGVGIPEDRLATLWLGLDEGALDEQRIGLGLPLTQFIAQAHGGSVTVESKHGAGSTFQLILPRAVGD